MPLANHDLLVSHARANGAISTDESMRLLGVSRATAQRRLRKLVADGRLVPEGAGRGARYVLPKTRWERPLDGLEEDRLWGEVRPALADLGLSERELGTVGYTFTEMVNNAIDHSGGGMVCATATASPSGIIIEIVDDGIGVFRSVRESQGLPDDSKRCLFLKKAASPRSRAATAARKSFSRRKPRIAIGWSREKWHGLLTTRPTTLPSSSPQSRVPERA